MVMVVRALKEQKNNLKHWYETRQEHLVLPGVYTMTGKQNKRNRKEEYIKI